MAYKARRLQGAHRGGGGGRAFGSTFTPNSSFGSVAYLSIGSLDHIRSSGCPFAGLKVVLHRYSSSLHFEELPTRCVALKKRIGPVHQNGDLGEIWLCLGIGLRIWPRPGSELDAMQMCIEEDDKTGEESDEKWNHEAGFMIEGTLPASAISDGIC